MKKKINILLLLLFSVSLGFSQKTITGNISNQNGPLSGANVVEVDTKNSINTDFDGNYKITLEGDSSTIEVSYTGFISQNIAVGTQSFINVILEEEKRVKRVALGLKIGVPNMASGTFEYVLPFLNNHIAPYVNYGAYDLEVDMTEIDLSYSEFGAKYYFSNKGKGWYAGVGISSFSSSLLYTDVDLSTGLAGTGSVDLNIDTTIIKLGLKTGGRLYFSFELGYGLGTIPDSLTFSATAAGVTETVTEDIPSIPGVGTGGIVVGNIGLGISF